MLRLSLIVLINDYFNNSKLYLNLSVDGLWFCFLLQWYVWRICVKCCPESVCSFPQSQKSHQQSVSGRQSNLPERKRLEVLSIFLNYVLEFQSLRIISWLPPRMQTVSPMVSALNDVITVPLMNEQSIHHKTLLEGEYNSIRRGVKTVQENTSGLMKIQKANGIVGAGLEESILLATNARQGRFKVKSVLNVYEEIPVRPLEPKINMLVL